MEQLENVTDRVKDRRFDIRRRVIGYSGDLAYYHIEAHRFLVNLYNNTPTWQQTYRTISPVNQFATENSRHFNL